MFLFVSFCNFFSVHILTEQLIIFFASCCIATTFLSLLWLSTKQKPYNLVWLKYIRTIWHHVYARLTNRSHAYWSFNLEFWWLKVLWKVGRYKCYRFRPLMIVEYLMTLPPVSNFTLDYVHQHINVLTYITSYVLSMFN